jgi:hypothetical protein
MELARLTFVLVIHDIRRAGTFGSKNSIREKIIMIGKTPILNLRARMGVRRGERGERRDLRAELISRR